MVAPSTHFSYFETEGAIPGGNQLRLDVQASDTRSDIFKFYAERLQFPTYFGNNWDAFWDCLSEAVLNADRPIMIIHRHMPLRDDQRNRRIYLVCLNDAIGFGTGRNTDAAERSRLTVFFPAHMRPAVEADCQ